MSDWNDRIIGEFRAKGGRGVSGFGDRLLLLHNRGARSGAEYVTPLAYRKDGDAFVVAASKGGAPSNPAWLQNLRANPEVEVEVGEERLVARAIVHDQGPERDRLWEAHKSAMPGFAEYEQKTERVIPVVVLEPIAA